MRFTPSKELIETDIKTEAFNSSSEQSSQADLPQLRLQADVPSAFRIALDSGFTGALFAVLGIGGGLYLLLCQLMPAWENAQKLQTELAQKQTQIQQKQAILKQIGKVNADLANAKQQQAEVLALFANEKNLDTFLLDLNQVVDSANVKLSRSDFRAKLKRFVPVNQATEVISDSSLGPAVNGKLKRRVFSVELEGTFDQTESILRNIERLQPLLIVKDYQSTLATTTPDSSGKANRGPAIINTSFQLQAIMPVSSEEAALATGNGNQNKK